MTTLISANDQSSAELLNIDNTTGFQDFVNLGRPWQVAKRGEFLKENIPFKCFLLLWPKHNQT